MTDDLTCTGCVDLIDDVEEAGSCSCCENAAHYACMEKCFACEEKYYCRTDEGFDCHHWENSSLDPDETCNRNHCESCSLTCCTTCVSMKNCKECGNTVCTNCADYCIGCGEGPFCDRREYQQDTDCQVKAYCFICDLMWCFHRFSEYWDDPAWKDCTSQMTSCENEYCQGMNLCGHHPSTYSMPGVIYYQDENCLDVNPKRPDPAEDGSFYEPLYFPEDEK